MSGKRAIKPIPAGAGFAQLTEAVTTEYAALIDLVRQALRDKLRASPGLSDYYVDIQGIWPAQVVCRLSGRLWSYPYTLNADNTVTIGDGAEVVASYLPVAEPSAAAAAAAAATAAAKAAVAGASAAGGGDGCFSEAADGSIAVTIIRAGGSLNGNYYPDDALQTAVPLFEGVRVFVKSDAAHTAGGGKDVSNLLGGIYGVSFVPGAAPDTGALVGTFRPIDPAEPTVVKMTEAVKRGMQNLLGLSIDATAKTRREQRGGKTVRVAERFVRVMSVDLIVEPGAGGGLDRLAEAAADLTQTQHSPGEDMFKARLLLALAAVSAARAAAIDPKTATDDQVVSAVREACTAASLPFAEVLTAAAVGDPTPTVTRLQEAARVAGAAGGGENAPVTRAELALHQARGYAGMAIAASTLPGPAKEKLQADFRGRERFTEADVDAAIKGEREYLARFTESGRPNGGMPRIETGDRRLVVADMLDAFFDKGHKDHKRAQSFKECYIEITGDRRVTGRLEDCDLPRMREALGGDEMREAIASTTFTAALGDSVTRRMQTVFTGLQNLQTWKEVATWGPVNDFRTQERFRIGGYGNLPAVTQGSAYAALSSPGDTKSTYAASKRGGLETITMEAIKNDDVQALRRIPSELALAAANTLYEFVFDFFRTNPAIYDTLALYHATHANLFVNALSAVEFSAHRLAMRQQTRAVSLKRLAVGPQVVLVPFELEETAYNLFVRNQNLDKTFAQTINPKVIPVSYWTDTNDWCTVADPTVAPVIEIGFLDGREDPELFVQDLPNAGSLFNNDQITYKIRHIYGGAVLVDGYKFTTKGVVP